jgi:sensor histidine kinase YesM
MLSFFYLIMCHKFGSLFVFIEYAYVSIRSLLDASKLISFQGWVGNCFEKCPFTSIPITIVIFTAILVVVIVWYYRRNDKRNIILLEQRLLLSQMNPHFVFNSLTAIQSYIFRNDPYMAGKYLANFSKLVRLILENSRVEHIPIAKEMETIRHYLDLQALRFDNKFEYSVETSPDIDPEHHLIPPMLAQPFIENAIEHGIIHLSEGGKISIRYKISDEHIILEVEDNGIGIERASSFEENKRTKHQSLATKITRDRLKNLRKIYGEKIRMDIIDKSLSDIEKGQGTLIKFYIPILIK